MSKLFNKVAKTFHDDMSSLQFILDSLSTLETSALRTTVAAKIGLLVSNERKAVLQNTPSYHLENVLEPRHFLSRPEMPKPVPYPIPRGNSRYRTTTLPLSSPKTIPGKSQAVSEVFGSQNRSAIDTVGILRANSASRFD